MRTFTLASLVAAAVVVGLVTLASSSAAAAPAAGGKRVARRSGAHATGAPPRVLPAPLPKAEALPPLPPVARDVTALTTLTSASVGDGSNAAWGPVVGPASAGAVTSEGLTPLPAPSPSLSPSLTTGGTPSALTSGARPGARETVTSSGNAARDVKPTGFVLDFGIGGLFPATAFVSGARPLGPGVSFDGRLGYYMTPHIGLVVGLRGSDGHRVPGCGGDSCDGYSVQAPVILQFAGTDRARGVYSEVGVGLGTTYGAGGVYKLSSPAELKLGLGYRFAGAGGARRTIALDLNLGADIGSITSAEVHTGSGSYSGSVDGNTHLVVALSLISHFSL